MTGGDEPGARRRRSRVAAGLRRGLVQGSIMVGLGLSSVGVTLGGLLTLSGLTYVLTENTTISYPRMDVALLVNDPVLGVFSLRSAVAIAVFVIAAVRHGPHPRRPRRDRNRQRSARRRSRASTSIASSSACSRSPGCSPRSPARCSATASRAASPVALADTLVPAAAAAIIGGVSLAGGKGHAGRNCGRRASSWPCCAPA